MIYFQSIVCSIILLVMHNTVAVGNDDYYKDRSVHLPVV